MTRLPATTRTVDRHHAWAVTAPGRRRHRHARTCTSLPCRTSGRTCSARKASRSPGPATARWEVDGQLLVAAGDNSERLRSEAHVAMLCGVAPLPG